MRKFLIASRFTGIAIMLLCLFLSCKKKKEELNLCDPCSNQSQKSYQCDFQMDTLLTIPPDSFVSYTPEAGLVTYFTNVTIEKSCPDFDTQVKYEIHHTSGLVQNSFRSWFELVINDEGEIFSNSCKWDFELVGETNSNANQKKSVRELELKCKSAYTNNYNLTEKDNLSERFYFSVTFDDQGSDESNEKFFNENFTQLNLELVYGHINS